MRPSAEEVDPYGSGEPLEMDYQPRKRRVRKKSRLCEKYHIDTNEHVNNCQYVQMAMEYIEHTASGKDIIVPAGRSFVMSIEPLSANRRKR